MFGGQGKTPVAGAKLGILDVTGWQRFSGGDDSEFDFWRRNLVVPHFNRHSDGYWNAFVLMLCFIALHSSRQTDCILNK